MTSIARIAANCANAHKSPRLKILAGKTLAAKNLAANTAAGEALTGKARVSRNARRHGLTSPLFCEGAYGPEVQRLARPIAGENACGERLALACNIASAQLDLMRIRIAKRDLQDAANFGTADDKHPCDMSVLPQLERLDRHEQRVFTRRRRAIREFCKTKPMDGSVINPAAAVPVIRGAAGDFCKTKPMPAADDTSNNECCVPVGASVRSSTFTRPLSAGGEEGPPAAKPP